MNVAAVAHVECQRSLVQLHRINGRFRIRLCGTDEDRDSHFRQDPHLSSRSLGPLQRRQFFKEYPVRLFDTLRRDRRGNTDLPLLTRIQAQKSREKNNVLRWDQLHSTFGILGPDKRADLEPQGLIALVLQR